MISKYLLDTHVVLWYAEKSQKLTDKVYEAIANTEAVKYVSIVSSWEIAIKLGTEKLDLVGGLLEFYKMIDNNGFATLSVEREYLLKLKSLPHHHKDPFDRLLISTALVENLTLITIDKNIQEYDMPWIW